MGTTHQKVRPGDPLTIRADTFNSFIDAAEYVRRQNQTVRPQRTEPPSSGVILVRNDTGADLDRFSVMAIDSPLVSRGDSENEFLRIMSVSGVVPTDEHVGRFVVTIDPMKKLAIGRAMIDGAVKVKVRMNSEADRFADIDLAEGGDPTGRLSSGANGSAKLMWIEPVEERDDSEVAWAIARLGEPSSSAAPVAFMFDSHGESPDVLFGNAFKAVAWDGVFTQPPAEAPRVWIARPPLLQRRNFDGLTLEISGNSFFPVWVKYTFVVSLTNPYRTVEPIDQVANSYKEFPLPRWSFGYEEDDPLRSIVYAAPVVVPNGLVDADGTPVVWQDLNVDGRQWIKSQADNVFPVTLEPAGGEQGTSTAPASWLYDILDFADGHVLLEEVSPVLSPHQWRRPSAGQMTQATFGLAHYVPEDNDLALSWINEVSEQEACS